MSMLLTPEDAREAKANHPGASEMIRPAKIVMDDWSKAKAREDLSYPTFSFELHPVETRYGADRQVKAQEKFVKGLNTLMAKQARETAKRAKIAAKLAA